MMSVHCLSMLTSELSSGELLSLEVKFCVGELSAGTMFSPFGGVSSIGWDSWIVVDLVTLVVGSTLVERCFFFRGSVEPSTAS